MGIPKFFRWVAERHPSVIRPFSECPPQVDHLYLDMNGIIHNCTHTNEVDASKKAKSEKDMVTDMFAYLEKLFDAIQPRKTFFLAVDGVAPRAKMNQQRQRRYRSGYEMMLARQEALTRGEELPEEEDVFDSNCITPGTDFMVRISEHFKYFLTMKLQNDTLWQNCEVIFSGHDTPGEGEHKIVDYIRRRKSNPGYAPNETHCMYGLDADLIMLSLATHEPHFFLLREVVAFSSAKERRREEEDEKEGLAKNKQFVNQDTFVLLHLSILRQLIDLDMRRGEQFENYDLERVLDDFVFMCFFVGNDFLPCVPTLAIGNNSLQVMFETYRECILKRGTSLTRGQELNWNAIEVFLTELGNGELSRLRKHAEDEHEFAKKLAKRGSEEPPDYIPITSMEEWKQKYYGGKLRFSEGWAPRSRDMEKIRQAYVEGLMFVHQYYYQNPPSWKWYFPFHYAPLASDLVNLSSIASKVRFDLGKPFLPHQQLLAVLPPSSYRSLPQAYWGLMKSSTSPLAKYFPATLEIDREGCRNPWEGIVLIPLIEERTLLLAYDSVQSLVTQEDAARNKLGPLTKFKYDPQMDPYTVPSAMFQPVSQCVVSRLPFELPPERKFIPKLCPGVRLGREHVEGYANISSKIADGSLPTYATCVTVFGMTSRNESMLLNVPGPTVTADDLIHLVGKQIWVGYPHYRRAKVSSIADQSKSVFGKWDKENFQGVDLKTHSAQEQHAFMQMCDKHKQNLREKCGLNLDQITVLVYVYMHVGMRINKKGKVVPQYSTTETCYPHQLTVAKEELDMMEDPRNVERERSNQDVALRSRVLYIGQDPKRLAAGQTYYGTWGYITDHQRDEFSIDVFHHGENPPMPPAFEDAVNDTNWIKSRDVAQRLRIMDSTLSHITNRIMTGPEWGSRDLGMRLKLPRRNLARTGYAKLVQTRDNPWYVESSNIFATVDGKDKDAIPQGTWYFSQKAFRLIEEYCHRFEPLIARFEMGGTSGKNFDPSFLCVGKWADKTVEDILEEIAGWLESLPACTTEPMNAATDNIIPTETCQEFEDALEKYVPPAPKRIRLTRLVARDIYSPNLKLPGITVNVPLPVRGQQFVVGARVVNCRTTGRVPFGARGFIIRTIEDGTCEVLFDEPFIGGSTLLGRLKTHRGALVQMASLLVVSPRGDVQTPHTRSRDAPSEGTVDLKKFLSNAGAKSSLQGQGPAHQTAHMQAQPAHAHAPPLSADTEPAIPKPRSKQAVSPDAQAAGEAMIPRPRSLQSTKTPPSVSAERTASGQDTSVMSFFKNIPQGDHPSRRSPPKAMGEGVQILTRPAAPSATVPGVEPSYYQQQQQQQQQPQQHAQAHTVSYQAPPLYATQNADKQLTAAFEDMVAQKLRARLAKKGITSL